MSNRLIEILNEGVKVFDLGRPMYPGMPQSPNHPKYTHALPRRHGDMVRADGGSAANDLIMTGTHVGTHIDALAHVSHDGKLFGGIDAGQAGLGGRFQQLGVDSIAPIVRRGVLLDIPRVLGLEMCEPEYEISPEDLSAASGQDAEVRSGDVVLIRSGWGQMIDVGTEEYIGNDSGVPGIGEDGAKWLAELGVYAIGADTIAFERLRAGKGHSVLPAHRVLLVEYGIYIIEALELEELSRSGVTEFVFVLSPLLLVGATGSPVRPLALVSNE